MLTLIDSLWAQREVNASSLLPSPSFPPSLTSSRLFCHVHSGFSPPSFPGFPFVCRFVRIPPISVDTPVYASARLYLFYILSIHQSIHPFVHGQHTQQSYASRFFLIHPYISLYLSVPTWHFIRNTFISSVAWNNPVS